MSLDSVSSSITTTLEEPAVGPIPSASKAAKAKAATKAGAARLYAAIWRWHFIAGLVVTPVLVVVALMGALYVFHDELEPLIHPGLLAVAPGEREVAYEVQLDAVKAAYPDLKLTSIEHHPQPGRSVEFAMRDADNTRRYVYVNQYTGAVLGDLDDSTNFFSIVLRIHRQLFAGTFGRTIVELTVCWSLSTVLTGFYLGWKRTRKEKGKNRWLPRLRGRTSRSFMRELHIFGGGYATITAVLIMATGLYFTEISGEVFKTGAAQLGQAPAALQEAPKSAKAPDGAKPVGIDAALAAYAGSGATAEWRLTVPAKKDAAYAFTANTSADLANYRRAWIDQYSGALLADVRWDDLPLGTKITRYVYPIHTGSIFGIPSKIAMLATCLLLIMLGVTGVIMWWQRRPAGKLGVPARVSAPVVPKGVAALVIALGLIMPLMGASLVAALLLDWLVRRVRARKVRPAVVEG